MPQRGYFEGEHFARQKAEIDPDSRRFDQIMENVGWDLATDPTFFPQIPGTSLRRIRTRPGAAGLPSLTIYFRTVDPDNYELVWVEVSPDQTPEPLLGE